MSLSKEIADFGGLVGLLLALVALLTANRAAAFSAMIRASEVTRSMRLREVVFNSALVLTTLLVWLSGLPLALRALRGLHPIATGGPLRSVFVLAWVLLVGLLGWQVGLVVKACKLAPSE